MDKAKKHKKRWTLEEDDYLELKWGYLTVDKIADRLERSVRAVEHRAEVLGLGGMYSSNDKWMASDVARVLGVCRSTVCGWITKGGLKGRKLTLKDQGKYRIKLKDLMQWLENNQERWNSKLLEEYALGEEPEWLKEKRKMDSNKKSKRQPYTIEEDGIIVSMYKMDYTFEEISERTGRTVDMVKHRISKLRKEGKHSIPYKNGRTNMKIAG